MKKLFLFAFCVVSLLGQAQDFVIGGQVSITKPSIESYDSLINFYSWPDEKMIGQEFTYYNTVDYPSYKYFDIPYPWKDGRLRAGRYTSSQTAKDEYLLELKKKSGTKYKLTEIVTVDGIKGYVFTDMNGESILYRRGYLDWEFVCEGYKEKFRKTYVGKEVYYLAENQNRNSFDAIGIKNGFIGLQSREIKKDLPNMSRWLVKGMGVDTTYYKEHSVENDRLNNFCRLVFVIHNDELGDYEVFVCTTNMLSNKNPEDYPPKFVLRSQFANTIIYWGENINIEKWGETIPQEILSKAEEGDPDATYAIIRFVSPDIFLSRSKFSLEKYELLLNKAVDNGFIHENTRGWLWDLARHYIKTKDNELDDNNSNYVKGAPFLIKSANLGNKSALKVLRKCVEKSKIKDQKAIEVLEKWKK